MKQLAKYLFAFFVLALLFFAVDLRALGSALTHLNFANISFLLIISVVLIYISALKWGLFLENLGMPTGVWRLFCLYLLGYFVNLILPSFVGGDAVRSWYLGKKVGQHEALSSTILERYTGFVAMIALAFAVMWFVPTVTLEMWLIVSVAVIGLVIGTWLCLSERVPIILEQIELVQRFVPHIVKVQSGLHLAKQNRGLLLKSLCLSFLFHVIAVVNTLAAAWAVGWHPASIAELCVVVPIVLLFTAIPLTPNGLGIQEGAFFYFLQIAGARPEQALGGALVLRAKQYVLGLLGGIVWIGERGADVPETAAA